jgi:hypothetical protein
MDGVIGRQPDTLIMPGGRGIIHIDKNAPLGARQRGFQLQGLIALDFFPERTIDGVGHVGFLARHRTMRTYGASARAVEAMPRVGPTRPW